MTPQLKHKPSRFLNLIKHLVVASIIASPFIYKWVTAYQKEEALTRSLQELEADLKTATAEREKWEIRSEIEDAQKELESFKADKSHGVPYLTALSFGAGILIAMFLFNSSKYRFVRRSYLKSLPPNQFDPEGSYPGLVGGRKPCHWEVFRKAACLAYDQIHDGISDDELSQLYEDLPEMGAYTWFQENMQWKVTEKSPKTLQPQFFNLFRELKRRFTSPDGESRYYIKPTDTQGLILPSLVAETYLGGKGFTRFHFGLKVTRTAGVITFYLHSSIYVEKTNRFYPQKETYDSCTYSFPCPYDVACVDSSRIWGLQRRLGFFDFVEKSVHTQFEEIRGIVEGAHRTFSSYGDNVPSRPEAGGGTAMLDSVSRDEDDPEMPTQPVQTVEDSTLSEDQSSQGIVLPSEFSDLGLKFEPDGAFAVMGLNSNQGSAFDNVEIGGTTLNKEAGEGNPLRIAKGDSTLSCTFADGKWTVNVAD